MPSTQSFVEYVCEQAAGAGELSWRKMFGEYAIYLDGKVVALVCDESVFVKKTAAGRLVLGETTDRAPYPGAKPHFWVDAIIIDDRHLLTTLLQATAAALPTPKRKPKSKPKGSSGS